MRTIKVVIIDDSAFIRQLFESYLTADPAIEVVGTAADPYEARAVIKSTNPDVVTLDVEMPKMDGIAFLEKIMTLRPMPVVMASSLTHKGANTTFKALELGAFDYVGKPSNPKDFGLIKQDLINKVKAASQVKVSGYSGKIKSSVLTYKGNPENWLIAIGASTGGVEALREIVEQLPNFIPPVVITQHMPEMFTESFANRLNGLTDLRVVEAADSMPVRPGSVYIAKGSRHLHLEKKGPQLICKLVDGPNVTGHKPSVDAMFHSISHIKGLPEKTLACILTGMGRDGAEGLLALRQQGAHTIGQDEASCVVYGMPKAAFDVGAVEKQFPLCKIAQHLLNYCT